MHFRPSQIPSAIRRRLISVTPMTTPVAAPVFSTVELDRGAVGLDATDEVPVGSADAEIEAVVEAEMLLEVNVIVVACVAAVPRVTVVAP